MRSLIDLTYQRFNRLIVLERAENSKHKDTRWKCKCDCGKFVVVNAGSLRNKATQSCGCLHKERTSKATSTHGMTNSKPYEAWYSMKTRCQNSNNKNYSRYGKRGIKICRRWQKFDNFWEDMKATYKEGLQIDRVDNNGNYKPSNCKWSTRTEQCNNRRSSRLITYEGKTKTMAEWARRLNLNYKTLANRLYHGWTIKKVFTDTKEKGKT